jgi:HlyD family secretion protein
MAAFHLFVKGISLSKKETIMELKHQCITVQFLVCFAFVAGSEAPAAQAQAAPAGPIEQSGEVVAYEQVDLYPKIMGFVKKWTADIGDRVKQGDVLAELDVPELREELKEKEALVVKARADIVRAKLTAKIAGLTLERAKAAVQEAQADKLKSAADLLRWQAEFERAKKLFDQKVFDKVTLDETGHQLKAAAAAVQQAAAKVKSAEAMQEEAAAQREKADADIAGAEAHLAVATAEAARVNAVLQYLVVRAPFDGVVLRRNVNMGDLAGPPTDAKAVPMFSVARHDLVRIIVQVPEKDALRVVKGMPATIRFQALDGEDFKGAVSRTAWGLDEKTRTLRVAIDLDNAADKFRPGMLANVVLTPQK